MTTLLLVGGSTRSGSTSTAVLRTARTLTPPGTVGVLYEGLLGLPHFVPDDDTDRRLPAPVADLRQRLDEADAVLFCTPEYAGGLPGAFKNLLDWTVGGGQLNGLPVAWLNVSSIAAPTGGADAHASLATVLGYVGADVVHEACLRLPLTRAAVDDTGRVTDREAREGIRASVAALASRAARAAAGGATRDAPPAPA